MREPIRRVSRALRFAAEIFYNNLMKFLADIHKKPFLACVFCVIYSAISLGVALFGN